MINSICVRLYCDDDAALIENYDEALKDDSETWQVHHRLELFDDGSFANSVDDLKRKGLYYHRPAFELIFLKKKDHLRLHNLLTGKNPESIESQSNKVKEKWKDEEFRKRCSTKSCNSWSTKKIQGLPDQRKDKKTYICEYHKLYRAKIKPRLSYIQTAN